MKKGLAAFAGIVSCASASAFGQPSPFFGIGMVVSPLTVKWACGADPSADISRIDAIIAANPDDPAADSVQRFLDKVLAAEFTRSDIEFILELPPQTLSTQQVDQICDAALRLEMVEVAVEPLTPEQADRVEAQSETWRAYFQVLGALE